MNTGIDYHPQRRVPLEGWESSREVPEYHCRKNKTKWKKSESVHIEEGKRNSFTLPPTRQSRLVPRETFSAMLSTKGKRECTSEHRAYLAVQHAAKEAHFFLTAARILWTPWPGGTERLWEQQPQLTIEYSKGIWMLLSISQSPSGSPTTSHWGQVTCGYLQLAHGHP